MSCRYAVGNDRCQYESYTQWFVLDEPLHKGIQNWVRDLNRFYKSEAASHEKDFAADGFEWVNCQNTGTNVLSFLRKGEKDASPLLLVYNFGTRVHRDFRIGVPVEGRWEELLNSDSDHYGDVAKAIWAVQIPRTYPVTSTRTRCLSPCPPSERSFSGPRASKRSKRRFAASDF